MALYTRRREDVVGLRGCERGGVLIWSTKRLKRGRRRLTDDLLCSKRSISEVSTPQIEGAIV